MLFIDPTNFFIIFLSLLIIVVSGTPYAPKVIAIVPSPYVTAKVLFSSAHFFGQSGQRNIISNANDSEANVTVSPNTRKNPRAPHVPGNSEHYTESINLGYRYRYGKQLEY